MVEIELDFTSIFALGLRVGGLGRHLAAGLCASLTGCNTFVHVADPPAIRSAFRVYRRTLLARVFVVGRVDEHEMMSGRSLRRPSST